MYKLWLCTRYTRGKYWFLFFFLFFSPYTFVSPILSLKRVFSWRNREWKKGVPPSRVWRGFKRISRNWPARISTIALSVERVTQKFAAAYRDREEEFEKVPPAVSEPAAFFPGHKGLHAREIHLASIPIRRRVMRPGSRPSFVVNNDRTNKNQRFCLSIFIYSSMFPACLGHYNLASTSTSFPLFGLYRNIIHVKYLFMYYQCIYLYKIYFYTCTRDLYFFIFLHIPFLYSYYILFNLLHFYPSISPTHILQFLYILILSWIPIFLPYTFLNPIHFHIPIIYVFQFIPF